MTVRRSSCDVGACIAMTPCRMIADAVCNRKNRRQVMRDHNDRETMSGGSTNRVVHEIYLTRTQCRRWFIHKECAARPSKGARDGQHLALPAGQRTHWGPQRWKHYA